MSAFLDVPLSAWVASNALAFAFRDRHPVSFGHTLIVTRRVTLDWFTATAEEREALLALVDVVKAALDRELQPDGYNVGFNAGSAAGQTVMHLHLHVIPRYRGDMDDPSGGVRHVIPSKGNYRREVAPLATGGEGDPFAKHVLPLFDEATEIAVVAAFIQESGLERIRPAVRGALARGAQVRIVTGDYLEITQVSALELLLDWQRANSAGPDDEAPTGRFEARVIEVRALPGRSRAFHPKSWQFASDKIGVAFVGSSNLSRSALDTGIEWNLRVDRDRDAEAYTRVREAFEITWSAARALDAAWIHAYAARVRANPRSLPPGEAEIDPVEVAPEPHQVQREALFALREGRKNGRRRALVVLATGLGKTWLAAFDYWQLREEMPRNEAGERPRLLFLAHRGELLRQAAHTYRTLLRGRDPEARVGWFLDDADDLDADLVFASVAKLARPEHLARLGAARFEYVVVDEVHHAAAASYRRLLDAINPGFLLGLTATPDRADAADVLGLFDDHLAYQADIARGVAVGRLVPFHYFGVKDDLDYEPIPWRNHRFDIEVLARAAQTEARMETLWRAWAAHPGERTLVFCCSIGHATFVRAWLRARGVRVAAVFSGAGSDDRDAARAALERGELDALCSIDLFNEGVDVPSLDRVVMLRPTESSVVFLQQLGRGLRASEAKSHVTILDFVGNHRMFLERVRALLSLAGGPRPRTLREFLEATSGDELPAGCSVELELEAKELLARLFRVNGADEIERATPSQGFLCQVAWNQRDPILSLPTRSGVDLPRGETEVRLADGTLWLFRFTRATCAVARPAGTPHNRLPDLLRRWFGPRAGEPGTAFEVRFHASPEGLLAEPVQARGIERGIVAYPDLRAAAGHAQGAIEPPDQERVLLPIDVANRDLFAVRVAGTSMNGGKAPIHDGDWAVMSVARGAPESALLDRVVLVQVPGEMGSQYQIKRLRRRDERLILTSDNPEGPTIEPREGMVIIAQLDRVVPPESMAPERSAVIAESDLASRFHLDSLDPRSGRHGGHLFFFVDRKGLLTAADRIHYPMTLYRPGETAFALAKLEEGTWIYLGVARQIEVNGEARWSVPAVDQEVWNQWGKRREVSNPLPAHAAARAALAARAVLALPEAERWIEQPGGQRARVIGPARRGGLRVDGGEGGFGERTVSLTDLGWVIAADDEVREHGGNLDEPRVNRLRYQEGTSKGSTRWIDTKWALAVWEVAKRLLF